MARIYIQFLKISSQILIVVEMTLCILKYWLNIYKCVFNCIIYVWFASVTICIYSITFILHTQTHTYTQTHTQTHIHTDTVTKRLIEQGALAKKQLELSSAKLSKKIGRQVASHKMVLNQSLSCYEVVVSQFQSCLEVILDCS